jgi:hypothetical protein
VTTRKRSTVGDFRKVVFLAYQESIKFGKMSDWFKKVKKAEEKVYQVYYAEHGVAPEYFKNLPDDAPFGPNTCWYYAELVHLVEMAQRKPIVPTHL